MPKLIIDDSTYDIPEGKNVLEACLSLGMDLPYFCWHPAMGSVGACRQCAVMQYEDENDEQGKLVMSCMTPVTDKTYISLKDETSSGFRKSVIEWLMTNHPHDCPTCDEGGECHLQDMTVMTGHNYRRYRFNKRTYTNQDLGPCINHEMNRCIQCYRCVRFYRDHAGGTDLNAFSAHNHVYFGRHEDGTLESPFSGNLVEVCPTGVFTDKTLKKHYTRKWDLTNAPSICYQCGLGCNIIPGERYGTLRRIQSRYNGEVNGYFICDRGRFGYEYVNSMYRIRKATIKDKDQGSKTSLELDEAMHSVAKDIKQYERIVGIGSPRSSLESNFALRTLVGENHFYGGLSTGQYEAINTIYQILKVSPAKSPSMKECEDADAVLILGEDITHTAPMLSYAVRQTSKKVYQEKAAEKDIPAWRDKAVRNDAELETVPIYSLSPAESGLKDIATHLSLNPAEIRQFAFALAQELDDTAPSTEDIPTEWEEHFQEIVKVLRSAENPLIIAGATLQDTAMIKGAANISRALSNGKRKAMLSYVVPEVNSLGLIMMHPKDIDKLEGSIDQNTLVINLENDLYRIMPENEADQLMEKAGKLISLDHSISRTTEASDTVLPVGSYAESSGTVVNNEGRAQRSYKVMLPKEDEKDGWKILGKVRQLTENAADLDFKDLDDIIQYVVTQMPQFAGIQNAAPSANFRENGRQIPRQPHRYSGRTAMQADRNVHEQAPPEDEDSALRFSMEGHQGLPPSSLNPNFWAPGWNSQQAINRFQIEVGGELHDGDPGIRLLEPSKNEGSEYFKNNKTGAEIDKNEFRLIPYHHIFGSEHFSMQSPAIEERSPQASFIFHSEDARNLDLEDGKEFTIMVDGEEVELPVSIKEDWPEGTIGYPLGFPGVTFLHLPTIVKLKNTAG